MKPVKQEDGLGCAVACVAFVLNISYKNALKLFIDGEERVRSIANFYCPEIVSILKNQGLNYGYRLLKQIPDEESYDDKLIVFIGFDNKYRFGHFLCRYKKEWMDPWINLPDKNIKAGFRKSLPGIPTYLIYPKST